MVSNILEMLASGAGKDLIGPASKLLGESESGVQSALGSLMPVLLGSMASKASSPSGAADLFRTVTGANVDTGILGNIAGALAGGASTDSLTSVGANLLGGLLGGSDKVSGLGSALASLAGIKSSSAGTLMSLAAPFLFSTIKKLISSNGLDANGLGNLLLGQKAHLAKANVDPRLATALGQTSFTSWLDKLPATLATVAPAAAPVRPVVTAPAAPESSGLMKWLPWLAALIGAFLLWQWLAPKAPEPAKTVAPAPVAAPAPAPAPAPVVAALPKSVYFEVDKTDIGDEGKKAIEEALAAIGKDGKAAVTGYADKTGDPARNEELAKNRAKAVKEALVAAGLPEGNIEMRPPEFITDTTNDRAARRADINKQ